MQLNEMTAMGQTILGKTVSSVFSAFSIAVFLVVMPILVFFLLKDKTVIVSWFRQFTPKDSKLTLSVWHQVDVQIGNYVRGKAFEILLVGLTSYIVFVFLDLEYAILLATLTGFSVLVPFIGAVAVTIPIALVAFFQFGWTAMYEDCPRVADWYRRCRERISYKSAVTDDYSSELRATLLEKGRPVWAKIQAHLTPDS